MQNKIYQRHGLKKKIGIRKRSKTKTILVRHSDTPNKMDIKPEQILEQNSQDGILGFADHFIITIDGKVYAGRDVDVYGFTVSILMIGRNYFTQHQIDSVKKLITDLKEKYGSLGIQNKTTITKL